MPVIVIGLPMEPRRPPTFSPADPNHTAIRWRSSGHQIAIRSQSRDSHLRG